VSKNRIIFIGKGGERSGNIWKEVLGSRSSFVVNGNIFEEV
jgi:hypothetical protein